MNYKFNISGSVNKIDADGICRLSCSINNQEYLAWLAEGNTPTPADPIPVDGSINYKALIRREADALDKAGQPYQAMKLLKSIGE